MGMVHVLTEKGKRVSQESGTLSFFGRLPETSGTLAPIKSIRQLVFNWDGHLHGRLFPSFWVFVSANHPVRLAALWPDSSMEANLLHTLTQPQMELYFGFRTQYKSNLY
jgi:hypothetical protein